MPNKDTKPVERTARVYGAGHKLIGKDYETADLYAKVTGLAKYAEDYHADGMLYFRYESGIMALVEAAPKGYNLISSFQVPIGGNGWPHPVINNGKLYLRGADQVLCYDLRVKIEKAPALHPLQQAVIDEQAAQCGYCYNGMIVKGAELLAKTPQPTEMQIRTAMNGHLCRCGTYPRILTAIQKAAAQMAAH